MDIDCKKFIKPSIGIVSGILIYYGILQYFIINIIIFMYLLLKTINNVENADGTSNNISKLWAIYACLTNIDYILNVISSVLPFGSAYQFVRIFVIFWLNRSDANVDMVYDSIIKVIHTRYEDMAKNYLDTVDAYKSYVNERMDGITKVTYDAIMQLLNKHTEIVQNHIKDDKTN